MDSAAAQALILYRLLENDAAKAKDVLENAKPNFASYKEYMDYLDSMFIKKQAVEYLENGEKFDMIIAIGPVIMMKFVVETAKPYGTPVTVSMNPIMIDGTGMCGGCRLTLNQNGKKVTKFACVDGPDFNGYEVDFDEAMSRGRMYSDFEHHAYEKTCNLFKGGRENG
ncbi:MAG: hypothetical protein J5992_00190 [Oscillospiraceae bacterium]|nr:hypothetical protein [Oscillospiraceae bacterium]